MPVSKGRKKKKKSAKPPKPKKEKEPDEVYERDRMRWERRGKMTYLHNTRTEEEHQSYLDSLPSAIAAMDLSIKEGTEAIMAYFEAFDNIALLGGLGGDFAQTDNLIPI